jgi:beta-lactamase regulating signal transducer with metallopeptidase domain
MSFIIEHLNAMGAQALAVAWPMLWQTSLLIVLMLAIDRLVLRKLRPGMRYVLWLAVLVKLVLPPSLALPTSVAWWVRPQARAQRPASNVHTAVTYSPVTEPGVLKPAFMPEPLPPALSLAGGVLAASAAVSFALFAFVLRRWRQVSRQAAMRAKGNVPGSLADLLEEERCSVGLRRRVKIRLMEGPVSPALFGLLRPVILLPQSLAQRLPEAQLRSVLLHELIHMRRGDVWVNCAQTLLQIVYWWHPLVWVANHRIRQAREEAVDESVMLALRNDRESYAPALLEVARLVLHRPSASLGVIGILESHGSLCQRIEKLTSFHPPRKAGVTLASILYAATLGALALPMGNAPPENSQTDAADVSGERRFVQVVRQQEGKQRVVKASPARQRVTTKLQELRLERVEFRSVPLGEIVKTLADEAKRLDPEKEGVSFVIRQANPSTEQSELLDPARAIVRIVPHLTDVRLLDVLDAIVKVADKPIKYSVEDSGVAFSSREFVPPLYTRMFKVDPSTFEAGLRSTTGLTESADPQAVQAALKDLLSSLDVDFFPPKSIFWNDREGTLMVRATLQDLDKVETAIQVLSVSQPQLNIKAQFIELPEKEAAKFWGKYYSRKITPGNPWTAELTSAEARQQLDTWRSTAELVMLSQPSITTLSGRQAEVQVVELQSVVAYTNFVPGQPLAPQTNTVPFGPVLRILPIVSGESLHIALTGEASVTEFLGYSEPPGKWDTYKDHQGDAVVAPRPAPLPVPNFRIRKLPFTCTVKDGRTLVLGYAVDETGKPAEKPGLDKKRLMVFVTPTVTDPAGNRVHTDEEVERAR